MNIKSTKGGEGRFGRRLENIFLAPLPRRNAINQRARPSAHLTPKCLPVTVCAPSRLSYRKIGNYEESFQFLITWVSFLEDVQPNPGLVSMTTYLPCLYLNLELELACLRITRSWCPFLESADNISGPKSCFMFAAFAFMI